MAAVAWRLSAECLSVKADGSLHQHHKWLSTSGLPEYIHARSLSPLKGATKLTMSTITICHVSDCCCWFVLCLLSRRFVWINLLTCSLAFIFFFFTDGIILNGILCAAWCINKCTVWWRRLKCYLHAKWFLLSFLQPALHWWVLTLHKALLRAILASSSQIYSRLIFL